ncbi:MAG: ATP-binding protein [Dissulfurispiraceae bacterium]
MKRLFLRHTMRGRLLVLALGVEALMLTVMVANSLRLQHDALINQARWEAEQIAPVLNAALVAPLAQRDFATVKAVIDESQATKGIDYIAVVDREGRRVASIGLQKDQELPASGMVLQLFKNRSRYDVIASITQNEQLLGKLHFGLNLSHIVSAQRQLLAQGMTIAAIELILSFGILTLIGYWMTRNLALLTSSSQQVASGDLTPPPVPEGNDDVGRLGAAFNTMSRVIAQRVQDLITSREATEFANARLRGEIADRERIEEALRNSEDFIRSILDNVDEGFIVVDRDYKIILANKAFCQRVGALEQEVIGKPCFEVSDKSLTPCFGCEEGCSAKWVFETGEPCSVTHKHTTETGDVFYAETRAFPMRDSSGGIPSVVVEIQDITSRYLLEAEQLKTQKLEAIGTLAGGIAHDFNNLLQGIFGYIEMAKLNIDQKEKALAMLEQTEKALSTSVNLTTQLLTFSKGGKPAKKLIRLQPLIESSVKFSLSGSNTSFQLDIPTDLWLVEADEGQLVQVIQNIVLNASEAMAGSGTVIVSAEDVDICTGTDARLPDGGQFVRMDFQDSGMGIPDQNIRKIFDPYFTTKQKGSGLGLATSFSIIKNHGGLIEVKSDVNRGSTFSLYLPAAKDAQITMETARQAAPTRKGRILVMDDEELIRNIVKEMITALGHESEFATDGKEAMDIFRRAKDTGNPFDLVILDLTVKGGMGGEETIKRLREIDPHVKAIMSSGYSDTQVISNYRSYGFAAFLSKPYRMDSLRDSLNALIGSE